MTTTFFKRNSPSKEMKLNTPKSQYWFCWVNKTKSNSFFSLYSKIFIYELYFFYNLKKLTKLQKTNVQISGLPFYKHFSFSLPKVLGTFFRSVRQGGRGQESRHQGKKS